jgi:hypothetical protein
MILKTIQLTYLSKQRLVLKYNERCLSDVAILADNISYLR